LRSGRELETLEFGAALCAVNPAEVARRDGAFYARHPLFPEERCERALALAREFFALPEEEKQELSMAGSAHFRGYSEMRGERDWREQIHFGREEETAAGEAYDRLRGPNRWPRDAGWRAELLALLADMDQVARDILQRLWYAGVDEHGYQLLKLIRYHAAAEAARPGVAAHVDFSWITLLLQDDTGGLEIRTPEGEWVAAPRRAGTVLVTLGEILEYTSGGEFRATPHRVTAGARGRISIPYFLNPALDTVLGPGRWRAAPKAEGEHVHRVFVEAPEGPIVFGEEEWRRKGMGVWCGECCQPAGS
jgi:isopenicillin N synthase-like dioxygenase